MKSLFPFALLFIVLLFFWQVFVKGLLPIPSDTIIGLYHPFRDFYASEYPNGIPFKNFLITDPVRQQYPWRLLSLDLLKHFQIPLWNPYQLSGTPLLGNMQSAPFYPFNIFMAILPFQYGWTMLIVLQPLLVSIFLFFYLRQIRIAFLASLLGSVTFAFSGFSFAWLEWNTVLHVFLWTPLLLLSVEKILSNSKAYAWYTIFTFSLVASFFAGHIQTFFYLFLVVSAYILARLWNYEKRNKQLLLFVICFFVFLFVASVQWLPTLQLISLSARDVDQANWQQEGWFIPWQHLIQFIVPDFFGNPTTLNYWGIWNYAEFVGYIGIFPLIMAFYALFFRRDKKTLFFGTAFFMSLLFALPTFFAKIPYLLNIPFFSTSQPTRLLSLIDFSLAVLCALGFDYFFKIRKKTILYPIAFIAIVLISLWVFIFFGNYYLQIISSENLLVAKRNLIYPSIIFLASGIILAFFVFFKHFRKRFTIMIYIIIVGITLFDLFRFGWKFTPFTKQEYLFPNTKVISFLKESLGYYRYMTTDPRIMPPNFSAIYKLQSVDGYDPLYLRRYGEFIAASERGKPDISPPFGFNRIITPHRYDSNLIDLMGVKYILSLSDLSSSKLKKVFQEGQTKIYENTKVFPRTFFVEKLYEVGYADRQEAINAIMNNTTDLRKIAIIEIPESYLVEREPFSAQSIGKAEIVEYKENRVIVSAENEGDGFLILTDSFYPTWKAKIDERETKIYRSNYNFRGIFVPKGKHEIIFYNSLLSL